MEPAARRRAGVVIVDTVRVAMIERELAGARWYVFPGGGADEGETMESAAFREAHEELGLRIAILGLVAEVRFTRSGSQSVQHYFAAEASGGVFGTGTGPEFTLPRGWSGGTYAPVWLELRGAEHLDVRPRALFNAVRDRGVTDLTHSPRLLEENT